MNQVPFWCLHFLFIWSNAGKSIIFLNIIKQKQRCGGPIKVMMLAQEASWSPQGPAPETQDSKFELPCQPLVVAPRSVEAQGK